MTGTFDPSLISRREHCGIEDGPVVDRPAQQDDPEHCGENKMNGGHDPPPLNKLSEPRSVLFACGAKTLWVVAKKARFGHDMRGVTEPCGDLR